MPVCPLIIVSLQSGISTTKFLSTLRKNEVKPIIQAKVVRWIVLPTKLSVAPLLAHNTHWDLLLVLPTGTDLPKEALNLVATSWNLQSGVPSRMLNGFKEKNEQLLNSSAGSVKPPEAIGDVMLDDNQTLGLSPELISWISSLPAESRKHPISMLNLLSFLPNKKEQYMKYGAEFAKRVGSRHGGDAKIVGHVIDEQAKKEGVSALNPHSYAMFQAFV